MVELLAVIVILGVISTIGIVSVTKLIDKSRENYYLTSKEYKHTVKDNAGNTYTCKKTVYRKIQKQTRNLNTCHIQ